MLLSDIPAAEQLILVTVLAGEVAGLGGDDQTYQHQDCGVVSLSLSPLTAIAWPSDASGP